MSPDMKGPEAMTEWKPKAGEDAVVRVRDVSRDGKAVWLVGSAVAVAAGILRPLQTALSAEDAAVLRAADKWAGDFIREGGAHDFMSTEAQNLISAVERRRRSTPPAAVAPATPRDTTALRDAVVEAVRVYREKRKEFKMNPTGAGDGTISNARKALDAAHDALLAAEKPADPVVEAKAAFAQLEDELMVAPGPVMDRLRAALSALGDRGRG